MTFTSRNPSFQNKPATTFQAGDTAGLAMWVKQQQAEQGDHQLVFGRIQDTGNNFVVEGYQRVAEQHRNFHWVRIPCRRLLDARLLLGKVMAKTSFDYIAELERELL